jgi:phosphatidylglycerol:prolipoprotein diacylglycerol transferase
MIITLPNINPIAFSIYFLDVRWYSLAYIFGILFTFSWLKYGNKSQKFLSAKALDDWMIFAILSIILGGRLGYVLFYNSSYFLSHPLEIFAFWQGGMSFHGGLFGAIFGMWFFAKKYKINFWILCDNLAVSAPFGLLLGRIANFINLELYGRPTFANFGVIFPNSDGFPRHPSQLYEAGLEGLILLTILMILYFKTNIKNFPKKLSGIFLAGYGISRFIVEYFREPDPQIGFLFDFITMGQILSFPLIILGLLLFFSKSSK